MEGLSRWSPATKSPPPSATGLRSRPCRGGGQRVRHRHRGQVRPVRRGPAVEPGHLGSDRQLGRGGRADYRGGQRVPPVRRVRGVGPPVDEAGDEVLARVASASAGRKETLPLVATSPVSRRTARRRRRPRATRSRPAPRSAWPRTGPTSRPSPLTSPAGADHHHPWPYHPGLVETSHPPSGDQEVCVWFWSQDDANLLITALNGGWGGWGETVMPAGGAGGHVGWSVAPPFGLEPKTCRLTAGCSAN